jgi:predicted nuclease of predicted toxin-antitoxin system
MYLLIDECCGKALVTVAENLGHTGQRTRDVVELGSGADDQSIFAFARAHGAVFVTINRTDFMDLAAYGWDHAGVVVLPSVLGRDLARLFRTVLPVAEAVFASRPNMFVEIAETGRITSFQLPPLGAER